jgi:UDP-N-acetylmuramate dehydrogenase
MELQEQVPLSTLTTFKLGGPATLVLTCTTIEDIKMALAIARERHLSWYVLGGGSNLLVNDEGYDGAIIRIALPKFSFEDSAENISEVIAIAEAGVSWDVFVQESTSRGLWGLENLAGIPGTVGAAPVQNIGAYGVEVSDTLLWVEALDTGTNQIKRFSNEECEFGYRDSFFKSSPAIPGGSLYIIVRVAFKLSRAAKPRVTYADITAKQQAGVILDSSQAIADVVREIRSQKFPNLSETGTAGSFFKNPVIAKEKYLTLLQQYPELPGYPVGAQAHDVPEAFVKVSLAWILDKALQLKGYAHGAARLFEYQPLVLVAEVKDGMNANARDVDALALEVAEKVFAATGISIEREVRSL